MSEKTCYNCSNRYAKEVSSNFYTYPERAICICEVLRYWVIDNTDKGTIAGNTIYREEKCEKFLKLVAEHCIHYQEKTKGDK